MKQRRTQVQSHSLGPSFGGPGHGAIVLQSFSVENYCEAMRRELGSTSHACQPRSVPQNRTTRVRYLGLSYAT